MEWTGAAFVAGLTIDGLRGSENVARHHRRHAQATKTPIFAIVTVRETEIRGRLGLGQM
jgi:hypothetical protein